jgi:hypothetical protein
LTIALLSATKLRVGLAMTVAGIIALLIALSLFAHPSGDDFCYASKVIELGFFEAQKHSYQTVNGRYTATAGIDAFALLGDIVTRYPLAPALLLLSTFAAFGLLVSIVAQNRFTLGDRLLAAGALALVYVSMTPDPAQTFYWLAGGATYQVGNILFTVLVALLVALETRPRGSAVRRAALFVAASVCVVAIMGTNEVSLILTLLTLACGTVIVACKGSATRYLWLALLAIALVAAVASIAAPGNFIRAGTVESGSDGQLRLAPLWAALAFVPWTALRILYWLSSIALWASALLLFLVTRNYIAPSMRRPDGAFDKKLLALPAVWLVVIFALSAIGFVANRYPLPERAESVVNLAFLLGWYPSFVILAHWMLDERSFDEALVARFATIALAVGLLGAPTIFEAYKDVYRGYRYDREMNERWDAIRAAARNGPADVVVPGLSRAPRTLFATTFLTDAQKNACTADYFGVRSIRLGSP